jgi:uncharacterized protein
MHANFMPTVGAAFRRLLAMTAGAALILQLPSHASAEPAMWVVKDEDSTVYLLGTFHLVKPGTQWWSDKIDTAFKGSDELWLEAVEGEQSGSLQLLVLTNGLDPAHPLSSKLSAEEFAALDEAAKAAGLRAASLDPMRPWLAALTLAVAPLLKQGYDPKQGVDKTLEANATASRKPIRTFETPEQQVRIFADLSPESELALLSQTLEEVAAGPEYVDRMTAAWVEGDVGELDSMTVQQMKDAAPEFYETFILKRNLDWSNQIETMMKGAGTSFVAVGAGHLTGEKSLQALLQERGFAVSPY